MLTQGNSPTMDWSHSFQGGPLNQLFPAFCWHPASKGLPAILQVNGNKNRSTIILIASDNNLFPL